MNKDEMIKDIPTNIIAYDGNPKGQHLYIEQRKEIAEALYNANYRKVANDEIVMSKEEWETLHNDFAKALYNAHQNERKETAREILQELWSKRLSLSDLQFAICWLAAGNGIELE